MSRRGPLAGGAFEGLALLDRVVDLAGVVCEVCVCGWLLLGMVWLETPDVTVGCDTLPRFMGETSRDTCWFSWRADAKAPPVGCAIFVAGV